MPKIPIDYKKGLIYKIQHIEKLELFYIGSTTNFNKRKQQHKSNCSNINDKKYNLLIYKMIRDNGNWESFKMIIIKEYSCNSKTELLIEEDKIQREFKSNMNMMYAVLNRKQYCLDNKEYIKEQTKQYQSDNKEYIKEQRKQYRIDNKEKIKDIKALKIICECGLEICKENKSRHIKSNKHIQLLSDK